MKPSEKVEAKLAVDFEADQKIARAIGGVSFKEDAPTALASLHNRIVQLTFEAVSAAGLFGKLSPEDQAEANQLLDTLRNVKSIEAEKAGEIAAVEAAAVSIAEAVKP